MSHLAGLGPAGEAARAVQVPVGDFPRPSGAAAADSHDAAAGSKAASVSLADQETARQFRQAGQRARRAWGTAQAQRPGQRIPLRPGDLDILAHLVQSEAGSEPYAGKVAVAAVVINRVLSGRFPDSVYGVVFEQDAFEAVSNGWYWNPPSASAYAAVRDALRGWDPSGGALYYFNPAKTANAFIWSRPVITQIGNHIFAR
ncbi:MAG TPA: spore cortex-lytic enzyme [Firmicutes bacterium]|nr:spore cortex-lytic enzyme [Bacillota bacterium]